MAEVVSRSGLFSLFGHRRHHHHRNSVSPICSSNCSSFNKLGTVSARKGWVYPTSLKLKPIHLTTSHRHFHGQGGFTQVASKPQMSLGIIGKAQKWWEKGLQPNMKEVSGAQDLVDSLTNAGDKLVVVDFLSPGCGGCRALHPKICQLAETNPDVQFLQVNYEEHKSMCYSLNVHVLPFFRFYRGAHGRLCSFSCTNATIKKFKDALAKHSPDRCSLGPPRGLEEKELLALSDNRDLSFSYTPKPTQPEHMPPQKEEVSESAASPSNSKLPLPLPLTAFVSPAQVSVENNLVSAGR